MNIVSFKCSRVLVLLLALFPMGRAGDAGHPSDQDGTLVVLVTWGDVDKTPAPHVYVEAHGFVHKYHSQKSFVLKSSFVGRYEASLPPAVYDVFVSDSASVPVSKRVLIQAGSTVSWPLKLEFDDVYSDKSKTAP